MALASQFTHLLLASQVGGAAPVGLAHNDNHYYYGKPAVVARPPPGGFLLNRNDVQQPALVVGTSCGYGSAAVAGCCSYRSSSDSKVASSNMERSHAFETSVRQQSRQQLLDRIDKAIVQMVLHYAKDDNEDLYTCLARKRECYYNYIGEGEDCDVMCMHLIDVE